MAIAAGLCLLLCLIEGGDAMARTAAAARGGQRASVTLVVRALAVLITGAALAAALTAALPLGWRPLAGGSVALLAGLQWLVRAVLRLRGRLPPQAGDAARVVFAAGAEAVIVSAALGAAAAAPGDAPLVAGGAGVAAAVLVTGASACGLRGGVAALPEKPAKTALACCLTAAGGTAVALGGLPLSGWTFCLIAVSAVTFMAVAVNAQPHSRGPAAARASLWDFLCGDDASTWLAAGALVVLRVARASAWLLLVLLVPLVGAVLHRTVRKTPQTLNVNVTTGLVPSDDQG